MTLTRTTLDASHRTPLYIPPQPTYLSVNVVDAVGGLAALAHIQQHVAGGRRRWRGRRWGTGWVKKKKTWVRCVAKPNKLNRAACCRGGCGAPAIKAFSSLGAGWCIHNNMCAQSLNIPRSALNRSKKLSKHNCKRGAQNHVQSHGSMAALW